MIKINRGSEKLNVLIKGTQLDSGRALESPDHLNPSLLLFPA